MESFLPGYCKLSLFHHQDTLRPFFILRMPRFEKRLVGHCGDLKCILSSFEIESQHGAYRTASVKRVRAQKENRRDSFYIQISNTDYFGQKEI